MWSREGFGSLDMGQRAMRCEPLQELTQKSYEFHSHGSPTLGHTRRKYWLQYFLYQTLYVCDVERPDRPVANYDVSCPKGKKQVRNNSPDTKTGSSARPAEDHEGSAPRPAEDAEEASSCSSSTNNSTSSTNDSIATALVPSPEALEQQIKRACPMWMQERLHDTWLDGPLLKSQPQGADNLQLDVEKALARTHTQASINTSVGRESDEQHCFFAGHLLNPGVAIE